MLFTLGLLVSIIYIPGYIGWAIPPQWALLSVLLIPVLWLPARVPWTGTAFLASAALSLLWSTSWQDGIFVLWQISILALAFRLGAASPSLHRLWLGLFTGLLISTVIATAQYWGFEPFLTNPESVEPSGLFFNSVVFGAVACVIASAFMETSWLMVLCLPALLLAQSRGAWIAFALTFIVCLTKRFWPSLLLGCLVLAGVVYGGSLSDAVRIAIWETTLRGLNFLGHGAGSFANIWIQHPWHNGLRWTHPEVAHNEYLDLVYQFGIGSAFALLLLAAPLWQRRFSPDWYPLFSIAILSIYSSPWHYPVVAFAGACCAGRLCDDLARHGAYSFDRGLALQPWGLPPGSESIPMELGT